MLSRQNKYLKNLRSLPVFLLITAFLVLSYCPLRNSIQDLLKSGHETAQANAGHDKKLTSVICMAVADSSDTKLTLPEQGFDTSILVLAAIVLTVFSAFWSFRAAEKDVAPYRDASFSHLSPVPLYLKNRLLLI